MVQFPAGGHRRPDRVRQHRRRAQNPQFDLVDADSDVIAGEDVLGNGLIVSSGQTYWIHVFAQSDTAID